MPRLHFKTPRQEELRKSNHFCLIVHDCFLSLENNKPLQGLDYEDCPKAIRVPISDSGILEAKAFHSTARVRHVSLDVGFSTISPQVWRYCHSLRVVKLPDTVVALVMQPFRDVTPCRQSRCLDVLSWVSGLSQSVALWSVSGTSQTEAAILR